MLFYTAEFPIRFCSFVALVAVIVSHVDNDASLLVLVVPAELARAVFDIKDVSSPAQLPRRPMFMIMLCLVIWSIMEQSVAVKSASRMLRDDGSGDIPWSMADVCWDGILSKESRSDADGQLEESVRIRVGGCY